MSKELKQILLQGVTIIGIIGAMYILFGYILPLVIPFLAAFLIAKMINPLVTFLYIKFHITRGISGGVSVLLFVGMIGFLGGTVFYTLILQIKTLLLYIPFYQNRMSEFLTLNCIKIDKMLALSNGQTLNFLKNNMGQMGDNILADIGPNITNQSIQVLTWLFGCIGIVFIIIIATVIISMDYEKILKRIKQSSLGPVYIRLSSHLSGALGAYIKAQFIIFICDTSICTLALALIGNPYPLLIGFLIGIVDALPIFGSGIILLPYSAYGFLTGQWTTGFVLLLTYISCTLTRQMVEPKIIGNKIGISRLTTLITMYIGFQIFGLVGFVLGPIAYIIGRELYQGIQNMNQEA